MAGASAQVACFLARCLVALVVTLCLGCSGEESVGHSISGTVLFHGQPLEEGSIEFSPVDQRGTFSGGPIETGKYVLPAEHGLSPGKYVVRISSMEKSSQPASEIPGDTSAIAPKDRIPAEYNERSDKQIEITESGPYVFDFSIP